jgi:hypothetical protein
LAILKISFSSSPYFPVRRSRRSKAGVSSESERLEDVLDHRDGGIATPQLVAEEVTRAGRRSAVDRHGMAPSLVGD